MALLIKGGRIIDPANQLDLVGDILIEDGRIKQVGGHIKKQGVKVVDVDGCYVCPGFIDMHVHLREPGFEYKETIASGTRAAAKGGFTTVCAMPNTDPVCDNRAVWEFVRNKAKICGSVKVVPYGAITKGQKGQEITEMADLYQAGCLAVTDDGKPVMNAEIMRRALEYSKMFGMRVIAHCEDLNLTEGGQINEGFYSTLYGLAGMPKAAEEVMVARDLILAGMTGGRLHVAHVSSGLSVEMIRSAKARGVKVTAEVTPHHLTLTDEVVGDYDADTKVNPPLRDAATVALLIEGLKEGTIDCLASDHAPHEIEAKDCEYNLASFGIAGLETAVAVVFHYLVNPGLVDVTTVVRAWTVGPARVLGLEAGTLTPGAVADITVIRPDWTKEVKTEEFSSLGRNNPYKGRALTGWPWVTVVEGELVVLDGQLMI